MNSKEDSKNEQVVKETAVNEIENNLNLVLRSVKKFVFIMTKFYTLGDVNNDSFRYLRNLVTTDSLDFLTYIVPYFKSALGSCKEFFEFFSDIEFEDFDEHKEEIFALGATADKEVIEMLDISKLTQGLFQKRKVQAENLLQTLSVEQNKLKNENQELFKKIDDLENPGYMSYVFGSEFFRRSKAEKDLKKCNNKIFENKEAISVISIAMEMIRDDLTAIINNFYTGVNQFKAPYFALRAELNFLSGHCEKDPQSDKSSKLTQSSFVTITASSQSISRKISAIIEAFDLMHGDMIGLNNLKNDMNYIELWKTIFKHNKEESLKLTLEEQGYWNQLKNRPKNKKSKGRKPMEAIKDKS